MSAPQFTREDMIDAIATAISDSLDADWNSRIGAEAVVRNCGVFELYEALELADDLMRGANMNRGVVERKVAAALAKARGDL